VQFRSKLSNFSTFQPAYTCRIHREIEEDQETAARASQRHGIQNLALGSGNATINRPHIFVLTNVSSCQARAPCSVLRETAGGWSSNHLTAESGNFNRVYQTAWHRHGSIGFYQPVNCRTARKPLPVRRELASGTGYNNNNRPNLNRCFLQFRYVWIEVSILMHSRHWIRIGSVATRRVAFAWSSLREADLETSELQFKENTRCVSEWTSFNAFNHPQFDANTIQVQQPAGFFYNGSGV